MILATGTVIPTKATTDVMQESVSNLVSGIGLAVPWLRQKDGNIAKSWRSFEAYTGSGYC